MKTQARWWVLALAAIGTLWLLGCGQKKTESQTSAQSTEQTQPSGGAAEKGEAAGNVETGETMAPAQTVPEIWAQIMAEREKLASAIQNGQLKDVHHHAFGIRDLVVALAEKANVSSPGTAPKLNGLVELVKASASALDEMGDAGNLSGTQTEAAKLNAILDSVTATVKPE